MRDRDANGVNYVKASHSTLQQVVNYPCMTLVVLIKELVNAIENNQDVKINWVAK